MRFRGLDLNLLVAFEALMSTHSVTRAAEQLNVSQPAMSAALNRLRIFFGDDLLVAHGKRMHPTAFAESILPHVEGSLRSVNAILDTPANFDPVSSRRQFRLVASDYAVAAILHPLVTGLAAKAPGIEIDISSPTEGSLASLDQGKIDLLITPESMGVAVHPSDPLYEERQLLVGWSGNPLFSRAITEDDFFAAGHVAVAFGAERATSFADRQLDALGRHRRVEITAPFFTAVPWLLKGTMRLTIMHEGLFEAMRPHFELAAAELPFFMSPMKQRVYYHVARKDDPGLKWMRAELQASVIMASIGRNNANISKH